MVGQSKNSDRVESDQMEVLEQAQLMARALRLAQSPTGIENRLRGAIRGLYWGLRADRFRPNAAGERDRLDKSEDVSHANEQRQDLVRNGFATGPALAPLGSDNLSQTVGFTDSPWPQLVDGPAAISEAPQMADAAPHASIQQDVDDLRAPIAEAHSWIEQVERHSGLALGRTGVIPSVRLDEQLKTATEQSLLFLLFGRLTKRPQSLDEETRWLVFIANAALVYVLLCTAKINEQEALANEEFGADKDEQKQPLEYGRSVLVRHEGQEIIEFDPRTMHSADIGALAV